MAAIDDAEARFGEVLQHAQNLLQLHGSSRQGKGRRWGETSLNHAAVVLTVAAWQAYVEALVEGIVESMRPPAQSPSTPQFRLLRASASSALGRFNTPNAEKARELLLNVGFDPRSAWSWTLRGNQPVSTQQVEDELNAWLRVRHSVAHGSDISGVDVVTGSTDGRQTVRLADVKRCIRFFGKLVEETSSAARKAFP